MFDRVSIDLVLTSLFTLLLNCIVYHVRLKKSLHLTLFTSLESKFLIILFDVKIATIFLTQEWRIHNYRIIYYAMWYILQVSLSFASQTISARLKHHKVVFREVKKNAYRSRFPPEIMFFRTLVCSETSSPPNSPPRAGNWSSAGSGSASAPISDCDSNQLTDRVTYWANWSLSPPGPRGIQSAGRRSGWTGGPGSCRGLTWDRWRGWIGCTTRHAARGDGQRGAVSFVSRNAPPAD